MCIIHFSYKDVVAADKNKTTASPWRGTTKTNKNIAAWWKRAIAHWLGQHHFIPGKKSVFLTHWRLKLIWLLIKIQVVPHREQCAVSIRFLRDFSTYLQTRKYHVPEEYRPNFHSQHCENLEYRKPRMLYHKRAVNYTCLSSHVNYWRSNRLSPHTTHKRIKIQNPKTIAYRITSWRVNTLPFSILTVIEISSV